MYRLFEAQSTARVHARSARCRLVVLRKAYFASRDFFSRLGSSSGRGGARRARRLRGRQYVVRHCFNDYSRAAEASLFSSSTPGSRATIFSAAHINNERHAKQFCERQTYRWRALLRRTGPMLRAQGWRRSTSSCDVELTFLPPLTDVL